MTGIFILKFRILIVLKLFNSEFSTRLQIVYLFATPLRVIGLFKSHTVSTGILGRVVQPPS